MHKRDAPILVLGILITAVASCRPATVENNPTGQEPERDLAVTAAPTSEPDPAGPTTEPHRPSPPSVSDEWLTLGGPRAGLSLAIPPTWVNLTDQIDIQAMGNRLGINLVFAAESERTGRSLLAGKPFVNGAYVTGLVVAPPPGATDPAAALVELLATAAPSAVRLTTVSAIQSANGVAGYVVDVGDGPVGLTVADPDDLRTRVALFTPPAAGETTAWIVLLLSASAGRWDRHVESFNRMLQSTNVYEMRSSLEVQEGSAIVRGGLDGDRAHAGGTLERGVNDLWTFDIPAGRYATIALQPAEGHLDLSLTLWGPDRSNVARIDNGYNGALESAADLFLAQPGGYVVEVSDFARASGRYSLSLALSEQPQYSGGGPIAFGQVLQGQLPANGQHYWVFAGSARQRVSIVVEPDAQTFDAILELYGPDDQPLVALDEGFSGDPELISGFELPASGEYAILVRSFSPQGGPYTISLDEGDQPIEAFYDAGDLAYGGVNREELQRQEAHAWFLQGRAGDHILIRVTPLDANLDLDVWLLDDQVERLAAEDKFAAGEPETIELTLAADGQYIVLVRDFNGEAGEYEVVLGAAPAATPEQAGALSYGDSIIGVVPPGTAVAWSFNAQVGDVIDIAAQAGDASGDLVLQLQGPDGLSVLTVDEAPAGGDELIPAYVVPATGQWRIIMNEFFGGPANYRLTLERATP